MTTSKKILAFLSAAALLIMDQASKFLVIEKLPDQGIFLINANAFKLSLNLVTNTRLAFSINVPVPVIFVITGLLLAILTFFLVRSIKSENNSAMFGILLIIAGALSNLFDRIYHGGVIDFISINIFNWQFAIFNIADILIVTGVLILLIAEPFKNKA
ncbi:MAG: signal peptidase II [Patescibacteria group bacterium]